MSPQAKLSPVQHSAGSASRRVSSPRPTILIAEDSPDSREMMEALLTTKGYSVVAADDGEHALQLAALTVPNLILIDLGLPKLDGLTVIKYIRLNPRLEKVPIIVVSGQDPARFQRAAIEAGGDDYLLKPIDFDQLDDLLRETIRRGRTHA